MASIEIWIPWRNAHKPHTIEGSTFRQTASSGMWLGGTHNNNCLVMGRVCWGISTYELSYIKTSSYSAWIGMLWNKSFSCLVINERKKKFKYTKMEPWRKTSSIFKRKSHCKHDCKWRCLSGSRPGGWHAIWTMKSKLRKRRWKIVIVKNSFITGKSSPCMISAIEESSACCRQICFLRK